MLYLLSPRVWIAAVLIAAAAFSHLFVYRAGKAGVRAEWDAEKVVQLQVALRVEASFRKKEQELVTAKQLAEEKYAQLKKRYDRDAAGARDELGRLRDDLAALGSAAPQDPAASSRAARGTGLEQQLLGHCAAALVGVAADADRLEAQLVGLQGYVRNVCLKANP